MPTLYDQLVSAQLDNRTSDPSTGTRGRIWFRTDTSPAVARIDDGSAVRTIVTLDNSQTLTNKTLTTPTINGQVSDLLTMIEQSTPSAPASGRRNLYAKADG